MIFGEIRQVCSQTLNNDMTMAHWHIGLITLEILFTWWQVETIFVQLVTLIFCQI